MVTDRGDVHAKAERRTTPPKDRPRRRPPSSSETPTGRSTSAPSGRRTSVTITTLESSSNTRTRVRTIPPSTRWSALDVVVSRKLGAPGRPELAMGAIAPGGIRVLDEHILWWFGTQGSRPRADSRWGVAGGGAQGAPLPER
jgi:hypothetical protein